MTDVVNTLATRPVTKFINALGRMKQREQQVVDNLKIDLERYNRLLKRKGANKTKILRSIGKAERAIASKEQLLGELVSKIEDLSEPEQELS